MRAFLDGARSAASFRQPSVVRIDDVFEEDGEIFYGMEFAAGGSLAERVATAGPLDVAAITTVLRDACVALEVARERHGHLHAALNPSHLLFTADGRVKILNLGLVVSTLPFRKPPRERSRSSLAYLAPEQISGATPDHRTDLYSLGLCARFALTGKSPFPGEASEIVIATKLGAPPAPLPPHIPERLRRLLDRMTAPEPKRRPATASEILRLLDARTRTAAPLPASGRRRKLLAGCGAGLALLVVVAIAVALSIALAPGPSPARRPDDARKSAPPPTETARAESPTPVDAPATPAGPPAPTPTDDDGQPESPPGSRLRALQDRLAQSDPPPSTPETVATHPTPPPAAPAAPRPQRARNLRARLAARDWSAALTALDALRERDAKLADSIATTASIDSLARAELDATLTTARDLIARRDFASARETLAAVGPRMPPLLRSDVETAVAAISASEIMAKQRDSALVAVSRAAGESVGRADFESARRALATLPATGDAVYLADRTRLEREIAACESALRLLVEGARAARRHREVTLQTSAPEPGFSSTGWIVDLAAPDPGGQPAVSLRVSASAAFDVAIVDFDDASLADLLSRGRRAADTDDATDTPRLDPLPVEGVGWLLLQARGVRRAWPWLTAHPGLPETTHAAHRSRLVAIGAQRLQERTAQLSRRLAALEPTSGALEEWRSLVADLESVVGAYSGLPQLDKTRESLAAIWLRAWGRELLEHGVDDLFAGAATEPTEGIVRLAYDFSHAEQLADFVVVAGTAHIVEGALVLRGEARLLYGDPFHGEIRVRALADYEPRAPNVNVALWTREADRVTFDGKNRGRSLSRSVATTPGGKLGSHPNDYVAFGIGYAVAPGNIAETGVAAPVFAIVGGERGRQLHAGDRRPLLYCPWAEGSIGRLKGAVELSLQAGPESFAWSVGRLQLHSRVHKATPDAVEWVRKAQHRGSVTLFTNGREVRYARLLVEAALDPAWIEPELERRGRAALRRVEFRFADRDREEHERRGW